MSSSSLIDPVVGHLADLALWEAELAADRDGVDPLSVASPLVQRLRQVPDPRRLRGLRHPLLVVLVLTACATLVAGNDCVTAIRQLLPGVFNEDVAVVRGEDGRAEKRPASGCWAGRWSSR
ncbi:transposase family protein [Dactylosporangium sp. CA-152071]|uniref:transposase family protein n=1 Tax=Dactylosporangium sp. CA-152071 TaxID=3239933 RepID=UPI003D93905F